MEIKLNDAEFVWQIGPTVPATVHRQSVLPEYDLPGSGAFGRGWRGGGFCLCVQQKWEEQGMESGE